MANGKGLASLTDMELDNRYGVPNEIIKSHGWGYGKIQGSGSTSLSSGGFAFWKTEEL